MSQSVPETPPPPPNPTRSADDSLPPVEAPSAKFLIQLFVVPAVIVSMIVLVWFTVTWLASGGDDPNQYVAALKRTGPARFQSANNLAAALSNDKKHEDFKRDPVAAGEVAALLAEELKSDSMKEEDVTLRQFLCKALGEFYVDAGVPVLLEAATTQRADVEVHVQRAAIESLAVLADHLQNQSPPQSLEHPELDSTLLALSQDADPTLRYTTAMALGVIGGPANLTRLEAMLRDGNIDVRYNAALGLARHGNEKALPVLLTMLEPEQADALKLEKVAEAQDFKRIAILSNAMRAVLLLHKENPQADIGPAVAAIEQLRDQTEDGRTRLNAEQVLIELKMMGKQQPASSASK